MATFHLFDCVGIELEYMVVDQQSLRPRSIVDRLFARAATDATQVGSDGDTHPSELEFDEIGWSNELARHVLEFKTAQPTSDWNALASLFQREVARANTYLASEGACLMSSAMHPWMDPAREGEVWPHGQREIYETYNRIFDCRGHGWYNLQSMHINLPFSGDVEFRRLHSAARVVLPLIPALCASSPFAEGRVTDELCHRLYVYAQNQRRVPSIAGKVVPDVITTISQYHDEILEPMFQEIAPLDPEGILRHEWLNSRGAIARFDRDAIELRVADLQECPLRDIAIAFLVQRIMKDLCEARDASLVDQESLHTEGLAKQLWASAKSARQSTILDPNWSAFLGGRDCKSIGELVATLSRRVLLDGDVPPALEATITTLAEDDCLAVRMRASFDSGAGDPQARLHGIAQELSECVAAGRSFSAES